ncbi:MAG: ATP-binding protein [Lysobacter sp.]|nr:ATP-binding protein [Lysobacter sp.]
MTPTERDPRVLWVAVPSLVALALVLLMGIPGPFEGALLLALVLVLTGMAWRILTGRPSHLRSIGSLLDALREGDYGVRGTLPERRDDFHEIVRSFNELAARVQDERRDLHESLQLLSKTLAALDGAVFAFDEGQRLRLVNPAGERLLGRSGQDVLGRDAAELDLMPLFQLASGTIHACTFCAQPGRWQITHAVLRSRGQAGRLLLVQPMERALRDEEAQAFRRLLRVLSHEINNSMAPIASMADTLQRMLSARDARPGTELDADLRHGLGLIEQRSAALQRFIGGYAQLAKLPPPQLHPTALAPLCERVGLLLNDPRIVIVPGEDLDLLADVDQLEHVLINLLRNALEAGGDGPVLLQWTRSDHQATIEIVDGGHGLPASENLFVPFFTTKPGGAGIGLALCRQIVEAQNGSLALHPRADAPGTVAVIGLPLSN